MDQFNFTHKNNITPPRPLLPILEKTKIAYLFWYDYYQIIPKNHRYSLGRRIDSIFVEIIESLVSASFLVGKEKLPYIRFAIRKIDTLKIFLMILWETKSLDDKKYIALSLKIDEIGKMSGGWHGQVQKQNSPEGEK
jgi:hypothetical protein